MNDRLQESTIDREFPDNRAFLREPRRAEPRLEVALVTGSGTDSFLPAPDLADDLQRLGQRVQLIRPRRHKWEQPGSTDRFKEVLLPRHPSPARLIHHWRLHTPDIVHILDSGYLGWVATHTARQLGIPVSVACHGPLRQAWEPGYEQRPWQQRFVQGWKRHICRSAHALIAANHEDIAALRRQGLHHTRQAARGIDLAHWHPSQRSLSLRHQWGIRADTPVLAHWGPVDDVLTINSLRNAMAALLERHPQARLLLINGGRIPTRLQALRPLRSEDWRDNPLGRRNHDRQCPLATLLASADILLVPRPESCPELIPHALASGLALIARRTELTRIHIEDGHNGLLVAAAEDDSSQYPALFADALRQLTSHATTLPRLRLRAPTSVAHLERRQAADQLVRVFKEVIQGHARCQRAANTLVIATD